jgi:hypothetical protein
MDIILKMDEPWNLNLGGGGRSSAIGTAKSILTCNIQDHIKTWDMTSLASG